MSLGRIQRALRDFQHNRQIAEDGITGPQVLGELRLVSRTAEKTGREAIREARGCALSPERWREAGSTSMPAAAPMTNATGGCRQWRRLGAAGTGQCHSCPEAPTRTCPSESEPRANRLGAEMIVSFQLPVEEPGVFFFASSMSRSEAGALLAAEMAAHLDLMVDGRAVPILKETRRRR